MSRNTTLPQAFPSLQPNSTTTDVIVNIAFGIAGTVISAFTIYHGHRMWKLWKLWKLNGNRIHDEEHELGSVSTTANRSYVNDSLPAHGSSTPIDSSVPAPTGGNVNDVEQDVRENDGAQP